MQKELLQRVYTECGVDPTEVAYVETHGTGTKAGDPQEINAITDVFCNERRTDPLLIGSTKSNMGHPEGASGNGITICFYHQYGIFTSNNSPYRAIFVHLLKTSMYMVIK